MLFGLLEEISGRYPHVTGSYHQELGHHIKKHQQTSENITLLPIIQRLGISISEHTPSSPSPRPATPSAYAEAERTNFNLTLDRLGFDGIRTATEWIEVSKGGSPTSDKAAKKPNGANGTTTEDDREVDERGRIVDNEREGMADRIMSHVSELVSELLAAE
ncbi:hypothetical protein BT69DRAFT_207788 [Atractiella rhizophila]|nr:hypothetical protein BT69DRAFT_207788 [Atractiella rhizophila]